MPIQPQSLEEVLAALRRVGGTGTAAQSVAAGGFKGMDMGAEARKAAFEKRLKEAGLISVTPQLTATAARAGIDLTGKPEVTQEMAGATARAAQDVSSLAETTRSNQATEAQRTAQLAETERANRADESYKNAGLITPREAEDALGMALSGKATPEKVKALREFIRQKGSAGTQEMATDSAMNTLNTMQKLLEKTWRGPGGVADVVGGEGVAGGRFGTKDRQTYNSMREAFSVQLYRAITRDTRLSDNDVKRALGMTPKIDADLLTWNGQRYPDSQAVIDQKMQILRTAIQRAQEIQKASPELFNYEGLSDAEARTKASSIFNAVLSSVQNPANGSGQSGSEPQMLTATNPSTGARIVSNDGGQTWQPAQ